MQTPTQIANDALTQIGQGLISDISSTNVNAILCKQYYDICWEEVLREFPWKEVLKRIEIVGDIAEDEDGKDYIFLLPDDLVKVIEVSNTDNKDVSEDYEQRGQNLYGDEETVYMKYIGSDGFTIATAGYDTPFMPSYVQHLVALLLASKIVFRITQNDSMQGLLYQEYKVELDQAMVKNNTRSSRAGEAYWTEA